MEHIRDSVTDYWATVEQIYTPFYSNTIKRDRFLHILCFLHFVDNRKEIDKNDENYDRLWKMWDAFEMINNTYIKYYNPSEHLAVNKIIVLFQAESCFQAVHSSSPQK
jgi:hypothetical protein